ncbi:MAG: leucine-rich repeat domain-containing protein [Prevotella sp.]|nr:leucine-rich repeat domain-containing protein [Prevotella sp.]
MPKKVKFPLDMGNEIYVRTLDELRENYNSEKVTEYFLNGRLAVWLSDRYYEEETAQVRELTEQDSKDNLAAKLGKIFGVEIADEVDVELLEIRREKLEKLRLITSDDNILDNADSVAFTQEDLGDLLDEEVKVIYLCGEKFRVPLGVKNIRYIGVNSPVIDFGGKNESDFEASGISFEGCVIPQSEKSAADEVCTKAETKEWDTARGHLWWKKTEHHVKTASEPEENNDVYEEDDEDDFTDDECFEFDVKRGWVKLTDYNGDDSVVKIPDIVNEIDDSAFSGCSAEKIIIPDSVEKIGDNAFEDCGDLVEIVLPDRLRCFGTHVFSGCDSLKSIELPTGIDTIGEECFSNCANLERVILPDSLDEIGENAFEYCGFEEIEIPEDVTVIGEGAFQYCESLEKIKIPEGVTSIGENAFAGCSSLKKVYLPDTLESLGENEDESDVFCDCEDVVVEYCGKKYKYGQLKSLYIKVNCQ